MDPNAIPSDAARLLRTLMPDTLCVSPAARATTYHAFHSLGVTRAGQGLIKVGISGNELRRWWTRCPSAWAEGVGAWEGVPDVHQK